MYGIHTMFILQAVCILTNCKETETCSPAHRPEINIIPDHCARELLGSSIRKIQVKYKVA
jgi:hypothetical protein